MVKDHGAKGGGAASSLSLAHPVSPQNHDFLYTRGTWIDFELRYDDFRECTYCGIHALLRAENGGGFNKEIMLLQVQT